MTYVPPRRVSQLRDESEIFNSAVTWIRESGLISWSWTNGQVSKEAAADGFGQRTCHPSFWAGVIHGLREYIPELEKEM